MKFRTESTPLRLNGLISHTTPVMLLGSCFAANIGARMEEEGFDVCVNPFGTLYNPASIASLCSRMAGGKEFDSGDMAWRDGAWHCWHAHSSLSYPGNEPEALERLNGALARAAEFLKRSRIVILTLGTRHIFSLAGTKTVVANCHKFPAATFSEADLSVCQAETLLRSAISDIRRVSPGATVILTVSPVRYTSGDLHSNTLNKATLHLACDAVVGSVEDTIYFPAYEALVDDLRDYRFYAADMKHPSEIAVDYIYSLFAESFYSPSTKALAAQSLRQSRRKAHRPLISGPGQ